MLRTLFLLCAVVATSAFHINFNLPPTLRVDYVEIKECGSRDYVKDITLRLPNPIPLPGTFNAYLSANVVKPIPNADVELTMKKKVGLWVEIPCLFDIGSCRYEDVCELLKPNGESSTVSDILDNAGWGYCPFTGPYKMKDAGFDVTIPEIPSWLDWLATGDYYAKAKILKRGSRSDYTCVEAEFKIKSA